jgi:hypothetical protein
MCVLMRNDVRLSIKGTSLTLATLPENRESGMVFYMLRRPVFSTDNALARHSTL